MLRVRYVLSPQVLSLSYTHTHTPGPLCALSTGSLCVCECLSSTLSRSLSVLSAQVLCVFANPCLYYVFVCMYVETYMFSMRIQCIHFVKHVYAYKSILCVSVCVFVCVCVCVCVVCTYKRTARLLHLHVCTYECLCIRYKNEYQGTKTLVLCFQCFRACVFSI